MRVNRGGEHAGDERIEVGQAIDLERVGQLADPGAHADEGHGAAVEDEQALDVLLVLWSPGDRLVHVARDARDAQAMTAMPPMMAPSP